MDNDLRRSRVNLPVRNGTTNKELPNPFLFSSPDTLSRSSSVTTGGRSAVSGANSSIAGDASNPLSRVNSQTSIYSEGTTALRKADVALEEALQDEPVPTPADASTLTEGKGNPYGLWECGFGFTGQFDAPAAIPHTTGEFVKAVKGELNTVSFIQNGLTSYMKAINSGEHHLFSDDFLKKQNTATHITIGQLFQIAKNLQDVVTEIESIDHGDEDAEVKAELKEAFRHAQPWIARTRAILVSSHVFYKINYVLASDNKKKVAV